MIKFNHGKTRIITEDRKEARCLNYDFRLTNPVTQIVGQEDVKECSPPVRRFVRRGQKTPRTRSHEERKENDKRWFAVGKRKEDRK